MCSYHLALGSQYAFPDWSSVRYSLPFDDLISIHWHAFIINSLYSQSKNKYKQKEQNKPNRRE